ncbi:MAG: metallophosphoesterase [Gemmatimonadota bacterium]|nr:metallophosphoesterase [Gemmatimonadota bacterium]
MQRSKYARPEFLSVAALLLALAVFLAGCHAGRLRGENYDADGGPFIRWAAPAEAIGVAGPADTVRVAYRVILAGDTGEPVPEDPTLAAIGRWAVPPDRAAVVLLGDNLYPSGLEEDNRAWGESVLRQQLEATSALRIFLPGNHDWGSSPRDWTGERVIAQQEFVLAWPAGDVDFLPRDGCPGPAVRELLRPGEQMERGIAIVAIDWLPWFSDVVDASGCTEGDFGRQIDEAFAALEEHFVIVASHYPLRSAGDRADLGRGMFIDILVNLYHLLLQPRSELTLHHPKYVDYAEKVEIALGRHRPLVYAAGHDHSLQLFEGDEIARMHIVSGAGSTGKVTRVTDLPGTIFAHAVPGFVVLDFVGLEGGEVPVVPVVRVVRTGQETPVFQMRIPLRDEPDGR